MSNPITGVPEAKLSTTIRPHVSNFDGKSRTWLFDKTSANFSRSRNSWISMSIFLILCYNSLISRKRFGSVTAP